MMYSRPFEKKDIDAVMHIWLSSNLEAHSFIPAEYWRKNTAAVRAMIPDAEVTVCEENGPRSRFYRDYRRGLHCRDLC